MRSLLLISLMFISTTALATHKRVIYDYARVEHVQKVYEQPSNSRYNKTCHSVAHHRQNAAPTLFGVILGGAIGNAMGQNSSHKKLSTLAGAALGGTLAHQLSTRHNPSTHCIDKVDRAPKFLGYKVTYRYKGERFHTMMAKRPGKKIKVKVHTTHSFIRG
ncbi:glycine zipper 2TM domain-containing protein [Alteromonadaceae bacterium BrNp21-10]|nr:glycine zipper 2TM domain-containing protein [Alteromonadaceae bacterium BrNp21-10]